MTMVDADRVTRVAVLGAGTIGASWTAGYLAQGMTVSVWDPDDDTEARVRDVVAGAWPALERVGMVAGADPDAVSFHATPAAACRGVELVQENAPERIDVKLALYDEIEASVTIEIRSRYAGGGFSGKFGTAVGRIATVRTPIDEHGKMIVGGTVDEIGKDDLRPPVAIEILDQAASATHRG